MADDDITAGERRLGRIIISKKRPWRPSPPCLLAAFFALSTCAWLTHVFSEPRCGHGIQRSGVARDNEGGAMDGAQYNLSVRNIGFGIAGSARLWARRKEYVKLWWRAEEMRGYVWLEEGVELPLTDKDEVALPALLVSEDISRFTYTNPVGQPLGIRIARIIQEMFKLALPDVRWFVMGDDDTIFCAQNLVRMLKKYDSSEFYYIGNPSESHSSNTVFSHGMAFGGGGIAISYALAEALSNMLDDCLERYPFLFGSDDRIHACITEIGVPLTKEPGFHQFDVFGNAFGLLAAHPIAPFISMHHLDVLDPVFPELSALDGLRELTKAMKVEPSSFLQQSICYDPKTSLTFSIATGYVVQVYPSIFLPRDLERPEITFKAWNTKDDEGEFDFDTRKAPKTRCSKPFKFFLKETHIEYGNIVVSVYKNDKRTEKRKRKLFCMSNAFTSMEVDQIRVLSKPMTDHWFLVPRRQCCKVRGLKDRELGMTIDSCKS